MKKSKMLSKKIVSLLLGAMIVISIMVGCSSKSENSLVKTEEAYDSDMSNASMGSSDGSYDMAEGAIAMEQESGAVKMDEMKISDTSEITTTALDTSRKLIKNVDLNVETEEFDDLLSGVQTKIEFLGGYIENLSIGNNYNYYIQGNLQFASITARIPADKLVEFVQMVDASANVMSRNEYTTDVTLQYVDMESHKKMLVIEQDTLMKLLETAETVEDIITIETRLSEVRYQIESMESQLRTFDNQVNYSTVYIYINEVEHLTPVVEEGTIDKIKTGFTENIYQIGRSIKNFAINTIVAAPYLVMWLIAIVIAIIILKVLFKKYRRRYTKKNKIDTAIVTDITKSDEIK